MKPLLTFISTLVISFFSLNAQTFEWVKSIGNINAITSSKKVFALSNDETFVVSSYTTSSGSSFSNILLSVSDPDGGFTWVKLIEGNVAFVDANMDSFGNIYLSGFTYDTYIKMDELVVPTTSSKTNFVLKLDKYKNVKWIKFINTLSDFNITEFIIKDNNSLIFCGSLLNNSANIQYHIEILDSNIVSKSSKSFPFRTTNLDFKFEKVCVDDADNIYVSGFFSDSLKLSDSLLLTALDSFDNNFFLLKLDKNLNLINGVHFPDINVIGGMICNNNHVLMVGSKFYSNIFLKKLDEDLNLISEYNKQGCQMYPYQISKDENDNYYVAIDAVCTDSFNFAGKTHVFTHFTKGTSFKQNSRDGIILKFDENLSEVNMLGIGNELSDYILNINILGEDEFLLCGQFNSSQLIFGDTSISNDARLQETYIHGNLFSVNRNPFAFYAKYSKSNPSTSLNNRQSSPITLFPNPASSEICLRWEETVLETGKADIFASDGSLVVSKLIFPGQIEQCFQIEHLVLGIYFIMLQLNNQWSTVKWIKH